MPLSRDERQEIRRIVADVVDHLVNPPAGVPGLRRLGTGAQDAAPGTTVGTTLTTKGDVQGYSTVVARVPVGADGLPLVANSVPALGLNYAVLGVVGGGTAIAGYTLGDTLYASGATALSRLPGNTTATRQFLRQVGAGGVSAAPAWDTLQAGDIPTGGGSPLTTKGDIYGYTTVNARVAIGPDGQVLTADAASAAGLKWAAAAAGTPAVSVVTETGYGQASAVGTGTNYARQDHTHGSPSLGASGTTAAAGNDARLSDQRTPLDASATLAKLANLATQRVIGRNTAGTSVPEAVTLSQLLDWLGTMVRGDLPVRGAATWSNLALGANGTWLKSDGIDPSWGAPGQKITALVAGTTTPTIPAGTTWAVIECWGAGGGGGSGARGTTSVNRPGGSGGAAGSYTRRVMLVSELLALGASFSIVAGASGTGGAAVAVDNTDGNDGVAGAPTTVSVGAVVVCAAYGGTFGRGGPRGSSTIAGGVATLSPPAYAVGGDGGIGRAALNAGAGVSASQGPGGGGGGGGLSTVNARQNGGNGGLGGVAYNNSVTTAPAGATVDAAAGTNAPLPANGTRPGEGGGGGTSSTVGSAGKGGDGAYGGGGGGGGSCTNALGNSGAGGLGGPGGVVISFI